MYSCQKEVNDFGAQGPQGVESNDRLLTKAVTQALGSYKFFFADSFEYDASNRCTRFLQMHWDSVFLPVPAIDIYTFSYHGNDTLPYKVTSDDNVQEFFFYDAQGRKIGDSIVHPGYTGSVSHFTYSANKIIAYQDIDFVDTFEMKGANCTRFARQLPGHWEQDSMTYDNQINPYS
jgi:hypothetical protein